MKSEKMKLVNKASELTFSDILLKGEAQIKLEDNGDFFVIIDENTTVCGVMESLYLLDNMGFDINKITFEDSEYDKDIFIISNDDDKNMLKDCLHVYKKEYLVDKKKIYDYEIIDDYDDYSFIANGTERWFNDYISADKNNNDRISFKYTPISTNDELRTRNGRIYDYSKLRGDISHPSSTKKVEECLTIKLDPSKFNDIKNPSLNLVEFLEDDEESGDNLVNLGAEVDKVFCEYIDLMNDNIRDESKYEAIHLKRLNMIEVARIKMKEHKVKRIFVKLEAKASMLCDHVKDTEKDYIEYIITSVLSLKKIADQSVNSLLSSVFDQFNDKIREQHEVILNILRTSGGDE